MYLVTQLRNCVLNEFSDTNRNILPTPMFLDSGQ